MTEADKQRVLSAAVLLWRSRRPAGWTHKQHMDAPAVNSTSEAEKKLFLALAHGYRRTT